MRDYLGIPSLSLDDLRRFWAKVDKSSGLGPQGNCWEWVGSRNKKGYGHFGVGQKILKAHRVAWFIETGLNPTRHVLHRCDNPPCVRWTCLFEGDDSDNRRDAFSKNRIDRSRMGISVTRRAAARTHCQRGHELIASNIYAYKGWRICRTCIAMRRRDKTR